METLKWTDAERRFPRVNFMPDCQGQDECPECHGKGSVNRQNLATRSPSDAYEETCPTCDGEGEIVLDDDRY